MIDEVDAVKDYDVHMMMVPMPGLAGKYQPVLQETDKMAEIGRVATTLFTLLKETQGKVPPPMVGVVVLKQAAVQVDELKGSEAPAAAEAAPADEVKNKQVEDYQGQIQRFAQQIAEAREALNKQEQIQRLQQYNRGFQPSLPNVDPKAEHLQKIAQLEQEMQQLQGKIAELQQTR
jgi:hypothetical protein